MVAFVLYNDVFFRQIRRLMMKQFAQKNASMSDKTKDALERMMNNAVSEGETAQVYLCTLQLPTQFADDQQVSNRIYARFQSDFCKNVMRCTGSTPRYVTVKANNKKNPEYAVCLFTHTELDKPEELMDKGLEIANGKAMHEGWGRGRLDVVELIRDAPKFIISSHPITFTTENKDEAMGRLQTHLAGKAENTQLHQRTMFVSKCW